MSVVDFGESVYPAREGSKALTSELTWQMPRASGPVPNPDGTGFVYAETVFEMGKDRGRTRLYWQALDPVSDDAEMPPRRPLTGTDTNAGAPEWSPTGDRLTYIRKDPENKESKPQLYLLRGDGGEPECLTDLPLGVQDHRWLPDGSGLVISSQLLKGHLTIEATKTEAERRTEDPVKAYVTEDSVCRYWDHWISTGEVPHLFVLDLTTQALTDITPDSEIWGGWMDPRGMYDIAPDGSEVAFGGAYVDDTNYLRGSVFVAKLDGSGVTELTKDVPSSAGRPRYSPDGKSILYGRGEQKHFYADRQRLWTYDRAAGTHHPRLTEWDRSPQGWDFGADGVIYFAYEDNARVNLAALDPAGTEPRVVAEGGAWGAPACGADGWLYATCQNLSQPVEIYRVSVVGGDAQRLTHGTDAALEGVRLGEVKEFTLAGAEGEQVQCWLVFPPDFDASKPTPLVHMIHGGPHGITADSFHFRWNAHLFGAPGYVVAMINFQGSTSWGNDFAQRIQGAWGDRPYHDVMACTDELVKQPWIDESRMAATGGSYGGYMVSWIAGHTDRFKCIVNHAGVYNTLGMYSTDIAQGRHVSLGGEPWGEIEKLDAMNPARFAKGMVTPMLVIHGEKDYRVPVTQGLECYNVLKQKGVEARLVYFPDENHWVLKPHNSVLWSKEVDDWLARFLK